MNYPPQAGDNGSVCAQAGYITRKTRCPEHTFVRSALYTLRK